VDQACVWLERAYAQRDRGLTEMKGDPLLKNLEADPVPIASERETFFRPPLDKFQERLRTRRATLP
jgi:hypothetical protein